MDTIEYFLSVWLGLGLLALQGVAVWLTIEGVYWIYCKINGKEY